MTTLNRFPLLGLWAEEAARRLGYRKDEAESLGHAYAVLYAIRARPRSPRTPAAKPTHANKHAASHRIRFCGDDIDAAYDVDGRLRGKVGGGRRQTPASYRSAVEAKFPPGYYDRLQKAFHDLLKTLPPRAWKAAASMTCTTHGRRSAASAGRWTLTDCWNGAGGDAARSASA